MQIFRPASEPAHLSLLYITVGCLTVVWTGVWYIYLYNHPPASAAVYYWLSGFGLTGLTLVIIGLTVGLIGRNARSTETSAPVAASPAVPEQTAAGTTPAPVIPTATAVPAPVQINGHPVAGAPAQQPVVANTVGHQ